jgi:hypothetical protein
LACRACTTRDFDPFIRKPSCAFVAAAVIVPYKAVGGEGTTGDGAYVLGIASMIPSQKRATIDEDKNSSAWWPRKDAGRGVLLLLFSAGDWTHHIAPIRQINTLQLPPLSSVGHLLLQTLFSKKETTHERLFSSFSV